MAAVVRFELNSFMEKFAQLSSLNVNANLHLDSFNGKIYVSLQAELGHVPLTYQSHQSSPYKSRSRRRRRRRQAARLRDLQDERQPTHCEPTSTAHLNTMVQNTSTTFEVEETSFGTLNSALSRHSSETCFQSVNGTYYNCDRSYSCSLPTQPTMLPPSPNHCERPILSNVKSEEPKIRVVTEDELNAELWSLGMLTTHELEARYGIPDD